MNKKILIGVAAGLIIAAVPTYNILARTVTFNGTPVSSKKYDIRTTVLDAKFLPDIPVTRHDQYRLGDNSKYFVVRFQVENAKDGYERTFSDSDYLFASGSNNLSLAIYLDKPDADEQAVIDAVKAAGYDRVGANFHEKTKPDSTTIYDVLFVANPIDDITLTLRSDGDPVVIELNKAASGDGVFTR
jgi:hypothetical protein